MKAGANMVQLTVLRRALDADALPTGAFAPRASVWARWTQNSGVTAAVNGQREDPIDLVVTLNDSDLTRTISNADRAILRGVEYAIASVGLPERRSGTIPLTLRRESNA